MSAQSFLPLLTGSFSKPAGDNPTVAMMEAAYRHHGLNYRYINMEVDADGLADAISGAKAMGYVGFNCSLPHKVQVMQHLDGVGESARLIGAVNCVIKQSDGRWIGENTDGVGFLESLKEIIEPAGLEMVILGAGGAARAIAVELALAGVRKLHIVNRSASRSQELAAHLAAHTGAEAVPVSWTCAYDLPASASVVINATSIGLAPNGHVVPEVNFETLRPNMIVADVIPNPPKTAWLAEAAKRGCRTLDGLGMLANQGARNFNYWTGVTADKRIMRQVLSEIFEGY